MEKFNKDPYVRRLVTLEIIKKLQGNPQKKNCLNQAKNTTI